MQSTAARFTQLKCRFSPLVSRYNYGQIDQWLEEILSPELIPLKHSNLFPSKPGFVSLLSTLSECLISFDGFITLRSSEGWMWRLFTLA